MSRVQIAVDEAKEQIGFALLPFMEKLAKFVTDNLVPALEGLVNGLTRSGKQGLTKAFYDAGTGAVTFGYDLESTEGQAYLLGEQIRQLGDALGKLLAIDPNSGESLLIKLIDSLTKIIEKTEAAVRAFEECPYDKLKIVMLGQDPYPGLNQADGIAFSLSQTPEMQPSLKFYERTRLGFHTN